jgi:hypothetical protein
LAVPLRDQFLVQSFHLCERLSPAERIRYRLAPLAQTRGERGVIQNLCQSRLESGAIMGHNETRTVIHHRSNSAAIGDQNRSTARDCFRGRIAEILVL